MSRPRRRGRDVHGVLLLDKPQGASSNDVLQKVKRIYNANRAGHTGALDPLATGCSRSAWVKRQSFPSICWIPISATA
ncbi:tRNA pseudouridine synthase B [Enterobacter hormaechei]|nr:tRNA pseudouridine synthase B [Enterobacter hormaechei]